MKFSLTALFAAFVLTLLSTVSLAGDLRRDDDRTLRETSVAYVVNHKNGVKERVVVTYQARVAAKVWQSGGASTPLSGHWVDDRKCHATITPRVERTAYLVSESGVRASLEKYQDVYRATVNTSRGPDNDLEALTRHVTCGDVNTFQSNIDDADTALVKQFDELIAKDDDKARIRLRTMLEGTSIAQVKEEKPAKLASR